MSAPVLCQLCARDLRVVAVRTYVDRDGVTWAFCRRHAAPLERREQRATSPKQREIAQ